MRVGAHSSQNRTLDSFMLELWMFAYDLMDSGKWIHFAWRISTCISHWIKRGSLNYYIFYLRLTFFLVSEICVWYGAHRTERARGDGIEVKDLRQQEKTSTHYCSSHGFFSVSWKLFIWKKVWSYTKLKFAEHWKMLEKYILLSIRIQWQTTYTWNHTKDEL